MGDDRGGLLISPDGVAPSRMAGVSASVIFACTIKVQKLSSGTSSPGWSWKKGCKMDVCVHARACECVRVCVCYDSKTHMRFNLTSGQSNLT